MNRMLLGRYTIVDPEICHGKPTFIGTRIMVSQVLKQVESGMAWEAIIDEWQASIKKEAIAEAVFRYESVTLNREFASNGQISRTLILSSVEFSFFLPAKSAKSREKIIFSRDFACLAGNNKN